MKFDYKEIYQKMYGMFRNCSDTMEFLAEQDVMFYYIAKTYQDAVTLKTVLMKHNIYSEHGATEFIATNMRCADETVTTATFDKVLVNKGRRIYTNALCLLHKEESGITGTDLVFGKLLDVNTLYILNNEDGSLRWIYVDKTEFPTEGLNVSTFPDGYKDLLKDKYKVITR